MLVYSLFATLRVKRICLQSSCAVGRRRARFSAAGESSDLSTRYTVFPLASVLKLCTGARRTRCTPLLHAFEAKVVKSPSNIAAVGTNCGAGLFDDRSGVV